MRALLTAAALAVLPAGLAVCAAPDPNIASTDPRSPADEAKAFHLPPGFEAQLVASEPDIHKPLNMAFDDRGRLWVTETVEYPFPAKDKPRDAVKVLEDFGPDGRARKVTTFATGLNIPIGLLPLPATDPPEALVFSIPDIWRVRQGGDRAVAYNEYGYRDTHGMTNSFTRGFDGWVYACHGFSNDSTVRAGDGSSVSMNSGNTYRFKRDGSHVEAFTRGQVNPFGLCFDPLGNLYSADCHSQPIYQLLRGGYYPSFGKPHDGLGYAPEMFTGYTDSTAIAGVVYYAADHYPPEYRDCAYIGDVVTNRLVRFRIAWHGSSPKASMDYFLKSDDPWFRPVAILLGPDGALYVADFYNRIIGHYEVPLDHPGRDRERGRVWRIVYKAAEGGGTAAPRSDWTRASAEDLVRDLAHPNLTVRLLATNELADRGGPQVVAAAAAGIRRTDLDDVAGERLRCHALWVLERCGALQPSTLAEATRDARAAVRIHAQRILAGRPNWTESEHAQALDELVDADANVSRAAADALGLHPDAENVRPLLALHHAVRADLPDDTHLLHVVRMALRDQLRPAGAYDRLPPLDRYGHDARDLAAVSLGVPSAAAAAYLLHWLQSGDEPGESLPTYVHHVARYGDAAATAGLLRFARDDRPKYLRQQVSLLRAAVQGMQERGQPLDADGRAWADRLVARLLGSNLARDIKDGVELVGSLQVEAQQGRVAALAADELGSREVRAAALTALANLDPRNHAASLGSVLGDAAAPVELREQAASLLARGNRPDTLAELVRVLPTAPARLQNTVAAGLAGSKKGAERLLEAVTAGKASARLLQERAVEVKLHASGLPDLKERLSRLTAGLPAADERLNELTQKRREGFRAAQADPGLGRKVFEKNCANCHQVRGEGAKIGPQLDGIGIRGLDRILEDTLDPNRNVDQAFRLTTLLLKKGQVVSGLLLREEGAVLVLADAQGKEVRVPKDDVDERTTSQQSPMPANFADQIPEADFYHLLAYLLEQRVAAPGK
jgi:putative membrane-bound dehydrogenase-like protein